jgi:glycosyltransferase involved in cell wall biosynthesis
VAFEFVHYPRLHLSYNVSTVSKEPIKDIVSVIVPTRNSSQTLTQCLESIKKQSYPAIEILVIDNFSTDDTPKIAQDYADKFYQKGPERSAQRNFGASKANGAYIAMIDSDMCLTPHVIVQAVAEIKKDGTVGVVIPEQSFGQGFWAQCKRLERSFYVNVPYMEAARFFRKTTFEKVGGYDVLMVSGEDWNLSQQIEGFGKLSRTKDFILHNEGHISLLRTIRKKYYYAQEFGTYTSKNKKQPKLNKQTGIVSRYWLFISHPIQLFKNPFLGIGMLFMKTCEFAFGGIGYLRAKTGRTQA